MQSELADQADVSARSIRNHTKRLTVFDFIRGTEAGWRFALPFHTDDERGEVILPWFVATAASDEEDALVRDVLAEMVYDVLDAERYADPEDAVAGALFGNPGRMISRLREAWEWIDPWVSVVEMLIDGEVQPPPKSTIATVGVEPTQASLTVAAEVRGGDG